MGQNASVGAMKLQSQDMLWTYGLYLYWTVPSNSYWQLQKKGYLTLDALEPAGGMLEVAREKNIYRNHLQIPFTADNPDLPSGKFNSIPSTSVGRGSFIGWKFTMLKLWTNLVRQTKSQQICAFA